MPPKASDNIDDQDVLIEIEALVRKLHIKTKETTKRKELSTVYYFY